MKPGEEAGWPRVGAPGAGPKAQGPRRRAAEPPAPSQGWGPQRGSRPPGAQERLEATGKPHAFLCDTSPVQNRHDPSRCLNMAR